MDRVDTPAPALDRLRGTVAGLDGVVEQVVGDGWPVWRIGRRTVLEVATVRSAGHVVTVITVRAEPDEIAALTASGHPFFRPRSGNARGRLGVVIDTRTDWDEIRELVAESCRLARRR